MTRDFPYHKEVNITNIYNSIKSLRFHRDLNHTFQSEIVLDNDCQSNFLFTRQTN